MSLATSLSPSFFQEALLSFLVKAGNTAASRPLLAAPPPLHPVYVTHRLGSLARPVGPTAEQGS